MVKRQRNSSREDFGMKGDPLGIERDELVIYLLFVCIVSGFITLLGGEASNAVANATPPLVEKVWSTILVLGGGVTLLGMFWQGDARDGLLMKRLGMVSLFVGSLLTSAFIFIALGTGGLLSGSLVLGFSWACFKRWRRINKRIREIIIVSTETNGDH